MKTNNLVVLAAGLLLLGAGCVQVGSVSPVVSGDEAASGKAEQVAQKAETDSTVLDLSGEGLTEVPREVFGRLGLVELDVSDNLLTGALPAELRQLRNLRRLDASGNDMTGVPAEIGQLSRLEELDLSDNQLTGLPYELGNLKRLRTLDLRGNNVSAEDLDKIRAELTDTEILQ